MSKPIAILASAMTLAMLGGTFGLTRLADRPNCETAPMPRGLAHGGFELVSETGETVTEANIVTDPSLIYFGYTSCPDVCPLDAARNAAAVEILLESGASVTPVFITIDPERDTVDRLKAYTDNFHPTMIGFTGSDEQVSRAAQAYGVVFDKSDGDPNTYLMRHSTLSYLVLPGAGIVTVFGRDTTPEQVAAQSLCILG